MAKAAVKPQKTKDIRACRADWRADPLRFMTEVLDVRPEYVWPKMREVAESVRDHERTAVGAGHGVSKTFTAARLALWFLICYPPATVVTTAPTHKQVEELLWREIREAHANAKFPLGGKITRTKLDFQVETGLRWYALGFATKPDTVTLEATAFQGYHNKNIMVIFDEAAGILPQIWKAAQHLLTSGNTRWLAIGNPTAPQGDFIDCITTDDTWHKINISVKDTPNFIEGGEVVPGLSGRKYEQELREKYGENSNEYKVRILGQPPDYGEGTFFGKEMAEIAEKGQIGFYPRDAAAKVYTFWDIGHMHTVIWFAQFIKQQIRLIDFYYDSKGMGLPKHAVMLQQKGYVYAQHFAPWDIQGPNAKSFQTGTYTLDVARGLDINFHVLQKYALVDQLEAGRGIIPMCLFHEPLASEGVVGLSTYRKRLNPTLSTADKPVYYAEPVKDWTEHVGSAFCGLAVAYRYELRIDEQRVGYPGPLRDYGYDKLFEEQEGRYDPRSWLKAG